MADARDIEQVVRWLRARLFVLPDRDDPRRPDVVADIEAGLRRRLTQGAASAAGRPVTEMPRRLDRRFIRHVIAPELELYWSRHRKDPRP